MAEENNPEPGESPSDPELGATDATPATGTPVALTTAKGALTPGQRLAAKKAAKAVEKREFKEELKVREEEKRQQEQEEADQLLGRARPEPVLPAEVEQAARTFSDFMQDHRGTILAGLGGLVVIALVAFGVQRFMRSGAAEQAAQLAHALELANAPIDADDTDGKTDDGKPVFKTEQERAGKALAAFEQVIASSSDGEAGVWAKLASAAENLELGKYDEARTRFQSVYDAHQKEPALAARALEGVGISLEAAGKTDDAVKTYEKLKYVEGSKELSEFHLARLKLEKGDREGGKTMLKALYDSLSTPSEGSAPSRYLKSEVEVRLAEIDSKLVDKGSSGGAGGGGDPQQFSEEQIQKLIEQLQKQGGGKPGAGTE
jgi:tetratricopeptide (TPR) repeat protein